MNQREARTIVRTLRQGTVSPYSARAISVGTERIEFTIDAALGKFARGGSAGDFLLVEGDWGAGKSHLSMLCRSLLSSRGIAWICAAVDGRGGSLAHANRCVPMWLEQIHVAGVIGLRSAIEQTKLDRSKVTLWAERNRSDLGVGILQALQGLEAGWLRALGDLFTLPDNRQQRDRALALLLDVARLLRDVTGSGLVLMLDEAENISREWDVRGRRLAYDTLAALTESSVVKVILFVTPRFFAQVVSDNDRAAVESQWTPRARTFVASATTAARHVVPSLSIPHAEDLLRRVFEIYAASTASRPTRDLEKFVVTVRSTWMRTATRSTRLLVRLAVQELDLLTQSQSVQEITSKVALLGRLSSSAAR